MPKSKANFKLNDGNTALLCSRCSTIIKTINNFNNDELLASKGVKYLSPQYCERCKKFITKSNDCGCK